MMRVAVALAGTDRGRSGLGTYMRAVLPKLATLLAASGGKLIALGTAEDFAAYRDEVGPDVERVVLAHAWDAPGPSALWHLLGAGRAARAAHADVLLCPAANRRVAALASIPTVGVVHDLAQLRVRGKYDLWRTTYLRHGVLRALRGCSRLVTVSDATRTDLVRAVGRPREEIQVVYNGVDALRFRPSPVGGDPRVDAARAANAVVGPYILYASRLEHPGKNHLRLLRAYAEGRARKTHRLVLAGSDWGGRALIEAEITRLGLAKDVQLLGHVADEHLPGLVAGAEVVVMAGLWEGFGLPALEALAAGRPVCVARAGALPEVVGDLGSLFDPLDEASIREALDRAVFDEALRGRATNEGPAWARRFNWNATAAGLIEACRSAVAA